MIIFDNIELVKDIVYINGSFCEYNENMEITDTITNPVLYTHVLDKCYSHALESCFALFWIIQDLRNKNYIDSMDNTQLFVNKKEILEYYTYDESIDSIKGDYKGFLKELKDIVTTKPVIFEHLIENNKSILFKKLFVHLYEDIHYSWQRTWWNSVENYSIDRQIPSNIKYTDDIIYKKLEDFRQFAMDKHDIKFKDDNNSILIIDRKFDRLLDPYITEKLLEYIHTQEKYNFTGIKILEDLSLKEQIKLFSENKIFIFRHGSCIANLLWIPKNSIVIDLYTIDYSNIVKRICLLTNSLYYNINYNDMDNIIINIQNIFNYYL
jgi:hypothetical protein